MNNRTQQRFDRSIRDANRRRADRWVEDIPVARLNRWGGHALVVARPDGSALGFANRTQAERRADTLRARGFAVGVTHSRPFYVVVDEASPKTVIATERGAASTPSQEHPT